MLGYVLMPNHIHCLIHINNNSVGLNKLVANGKRFMAYEIVKILQEINRKDMLEILKKGVQKNEHDKGKKHQVFRLSFDARPCFDEAMIEQKLDYIHANPVSGKWNLVDDYVTYEHSSARFYEKDEIEVDFREKPTSGDRRAVEELNENLTGMKIMRFIEQECPATRPLETPAPRPPGCVDGFVLSAEIKDFR